MLELAIRSAAYTLGYRRAVALMMERSSYNTSLPERMPSSALSNGEVVKVWNYRHATKALRQLVERTRMDPKRVSLHIRESDSERRGMGIGLDTYKVYNRNNVDDFVIVSLKLAHAGKRPQAPVKELR